MVNGLEPGMVDGLGRPGPWALQPGTGDSRRGPPPQPTPAVAWVAGRGSTAAERGSTAAGILTRIVERP